MKRPQSPCKGCKDRQVGCHTNCKACGEFKAAVDTYNSVVKTSADYGQVVKYSRTQLKRMGRI